MCLLNMIMDIQKDTSNGNVISDDERNQLSSHLSESIENLSLKISSKGNKCRYSSHAVNLAMGLFLKSKSSYELLRQQNLMSLQCPDKLRKDISLLRPSPGLDPKSMLFVRDSVKRCDGKIKGHLMMD